MPFVQEDGNGRPDANSYASVQQFKDFAEFRVGFTVPEDDLVIQKALVTATGWIDTNYAAAFKGSRIFGTQALAFPRSSFIDDRGMQQALNYMPPELIKATCILAIEACKGDPLYQNRDGAARVQIEDTVGPIIKRYAPQNPAAVTIERQFPEVGNTLTPLLRGFSSLKVSRC